MTHFKAAVLTTAFLYALAGNAFANENWPSHVVTDQWRQLGSEAMKKADIRHPDPDVIPYKSDGSYLNWAKLKGGEYRDTPQMQIDEDGLPLVKYGEVFAYNPVTVSQFALTRFSQGQTDAVIVAANKLISMQRDDGAYPYDFAYKHMLNAQPYKPGWISGMAQGQSLSALGRAYTISHDKRFLDAGNKALAFLQVPFPQGPMADLSDLDPSLAGYSFILEYPVKPHAYTLNGYLFAVVGLYDWWKITGDEDAHRLFDDAIRTLAKLVPYYDIDTISTYDIGYITQSVAQPYLVQIPPFIHTGYQGFHVELLDVLRDVTGVPVFSEYAERWRNQLPSKQSVN